MASAGFSGAPEGQLRPARATANVASVASKAAEENFPVALRLLPSRRRRYLMAVYVYARTVDDIGDRAPVADRSGLLAEVEADLHRLYGAVRAGGRRDAESLNPLSPGAPKLEAVRGLRDAVTQCGIPIQPFLDLIEANRQDQVVSRYQAIDDLLGYCRLSANPVGRIVLYVFGCFTDARAELSDSICSALQLAEHWQDVAEDYRDGRIYLPADDMAEFGCDERDLAASAASPQLKRLMSAEVARARVMLDAGAPLVGTLRGTARVAVAGYLAGGRAALAAITAAGFDVLTSTPRPGRARTLTELLRALARGR
ncbi:MAG TPA: squalene synthase HpnC [Streptosporangiaceae bacterium]|nr:squalene synthase HpnC [Streptosporangiaceae bacterium]